MSIQIKSLYGGFTQLPNSFIRNKNISSNARMLMTYLSSYAWGGNQVFPSVDTICDDLGWGHNKFLKYRKELENLGYLEVIQSIGEKGQFAHNVYILNPENVSKLNNNSTTPENTKLSPGIYFSNTVKKDTNNNKSNNNTLNTIFNTNNTKNSNNKKGTKTITLQQQLINVIEEYTKDDELKNLLKDFIDMRKELKSPIKTVGGFKKLLASLNRLTKNLDEKKAIVDMSIKCEWKGFYELKDNKYKNGYLVGKYEPTEETEEALKDRDNEEPSEYSEEVF